MVNPNEVTGGNSPTSNGWGKLGKAFGNVDFQVGALGAASSLASSFATAAQAKKQMDFQKMMSDTAHQRQVKDLIAAGLNPILATGGKGASTPSGSMAQIQDPVKSAATAYVQRQQLKNLKQQNLTQAYQQNLLRAQQGAATAQEYKTQTEQLLLSKRFNLANVDNQYYGSLVGASARKAQLALQAAKAATDLIKFK